MLTHQRCDLFIQCFCPAIKRLLPDEHPASVDSAQQCKALDCRHAPVMVFLFTNCHSKKVML